MREERFAALVVRPLDLQVRRSQALTARLRQPSLDVRGDVLDRRSEGADDPQHNHQGDGVAALLVVPVLGAVEAGGMGDVLLAEAGGLPVGAQDLTDDLILPLPHPKRQSAGERFTWLLQICSMGRSLMGIDVQGTRGVGATAEALASARSELFAANALGAAALDRLQLDEVPAARAAHILEAAEALIHAVAPVIDSHDGRFVAQVVELGRALYGVT